MVKVICNGFLFRNIIKEWGCFARQKTLDAGIRRYPRTKDAEDMTLRLKAKEKMGEARFTAEMLRKTII